MKRLLSTALLTVLAVLAPSGATFPAGDPLTPAERQWLDAHPIIRLAPTPDYEPTEFFDEQGVYRGITADIVAKIEERLDIEFEVVRNETWAETIEELRSGEVDAVPIASPRCSHKACIPNAIRIEPTITTPSTRTRSHGI